jgi:hypothetical protein
MGSAISYCGGKISEALRLKAKVSGRMNKSQSQTVGDVLSGAVFIIKEIKLLIIMQVEVIGDIVFLKISISQLCTTQN